MEDINNMTIKINNIVLSLNEDLEMVKGKALKKIGLTNIDITGFRILKESIDARKKSSIKFNYAVELNCDNESKIIARVNDNDVKVETVKYDTDFEFGTKKPEHRPIIIGMGPAGIFAGLLMAKKGYRPIIIERGEKVEDRTKTVNQFWQNGVLNPESNVQFGEGGAGTFSDGKLTTRIKDSRCDFVTEELVKAGAPKEIMYMGKPHVGTDILKGVIKNIRQQIIDLGGEVLFSSKLEDLIIKDKALKGIVVNGEEIPCESLILAIGHSSRDTYEMLLNREVSMEAKPFAIGVRIEHPQELIDESQYGSFAGHPRLRAADYKLTYNSEKLNRSVYSFCMCPGGEVVAAASEHNRLVINGMSNYKRNKENANSAVVVTVGPQDFQGNSPLRGMEFQRHYESLAFKLGGGNYNAPVQIAGDFLKDRLSTKIGKVTPSYTPGYELKDLRKTLPHYVIAALKEGLISFDKKIRGFASMDAVMTGIETRTSAPIRIERNENLQSSSLKGVYPAGEGAGYAGGIISSAVDGLKVAESIMKEWSNL
jgi:uncharacterized FAD-dependent dehydrogenase